MLEQCVSEDLKILLQDDLSIDEKWELKKVRTTMYKSN